MIQLPCNIHRPAAGVSHIIDRSQEGIRSCADHVILKFPDEEQHLATSFTMVDVTLTYGAGVCRSGLTLPVEEFLVNGVIIVHGRNQFY